MSKDPSQKSIQKVEEKLAVNPSPFTQSPGVSSSNLLAGTHLKLMNQMFKDKCPQIAKINSTHHTKSSQRSRRSKKRKESIQKGQMDIKEQDPDESGQVITT